MYPNPPNVRLVMVDADQARKWIAMAGTQRTLRPLHVSVLAHAMIRGEWRWGVDVIAFVGKLGTKGCRLANGQHRLHAVVEADELNNSTTKLAVPMIVADGYTDDAAQVFDIGRTRSLADALDFYEEGPGHNNISQVTQLAWHINAGTWGNRLPRPTQIQLIEFLKQNADLQDVVHPAVEIRKGIGRGSVGGYGAGLWLIGRGGSVEKLPAFIEGVATGVGIESGGDPRRLLRETISGRRAHNVNEQTTRSWWIAGMLVHAWNAYASGHEMRRLPKMERADKDFPTPVPIGFTVWSRVRRGKGWSEWAQVFHSLGRKAAVKFIEDTQERWNRDEVDGEIELRGDGPDR